MKLKITLFIFTFYLFYSTLNAQDITSFQDGLKEINISFNNYIRNLFPASFGSAFMALIVVTFQFTYNSLYIRNPSISFIGSLIVGIFSYVIFLRIFFNDILIEIRTFINVFKFRKLESTLL